MIDNNENKAANEKQKINLLIFIIAIILVIVGGILIKSEIFDKV